MSEPEQWDEAEYRKSHYTRNTDRWPEYERNKKQRDPLFEKRKSTRLRKWINRDGSKFTAEQHDHMLNLQCEVCGESDKRLICVDHDHKTNVVRGVLCRPCNLAIGHAKDSIVRLKNMIDYLNRS